jgi:hypothetical protein
MTGAFLIVHGFGGSGPGHWQTWLAGELERRGERVAYPTLPRPDAPRLDEWLVALDEQLGALSGQEVVVLAHSCGASLWLHHAARRLRRPPVQRVLLVAPPGPTWRDPAVHGLAPAPVDPDGLAAAAGRTRLVFGQDDAYCSVAEARAYAAALAIPADEIAGGAHLNTAAGYGRWDAVLAWALEGSVPLVAVGQPAVPVATEAGPPSR